MEKGNNSTMHQQHSYASLDLFRTLCTPGGDHSSTFRVDLEGRAKCGIPQTCLSFAAARYLSLSDTHRAVGREADGRIFHRPSSSAPFHSQLTSFGILQTCGIHGRRGGSVNALAREKHCTAHRVGSAGGTRPGSHAGPTLHPRYSNGAGKRNTPRVRTRGCRCCRLMQHIAPLRFADNPTEAVPRRDRLVKYHEPSTPPSPTPSVAQAGHEGSADAATESTSTSTTQAPHSRAIDLCSAVAFHGNFIMGSGFLGIPWAFSQAGVGLGCIILLLITGISLATAMMTVEVMAIAEAATRRAYTLADPKETVAASPDGDPVPELDAGSSSQGQLQSPPPVLRESASVGSNLHLSRPDTAKPRRNLSSNSTTSTVIGPEEATLARTCTLCRAPVSLARLLCGKHCAAAMATACSEESHLAATPADAAADPVKHPFLRISRRKFEIVELAGMFMGGTAARHLYTLLVVLCLTGNVWAYANVFGLACQAHLPLPFLGGATTLTYQVYVILFGVVVLGMACFDIKEQKVVQQLMTGFRLTVMSVMVGTVLAGSATGGDGAGWQPLTFHDKDNGLAVGAPHCALGDANGTSACPNGGYMQLTHTQTWTGVQGLTLQALARMLPIAVYSQLFHVAIPVLVQPIRSKTRMVFVYSWTYMLTTAAYLALAASITLFFGAATQQSSNLNWVAYGQGHSGLRVLSYLVVLFPALDVVTVTSISVITLASNTMAAWYGPAVAKVEDSSWMTVVAFRLAGGIPPVVGALLVPDFATVLDFTGLVGIIIAFIVPPWLWLNANYAARCIWGAGGAKPCAGILQGDPPVQDGSQRDGSLRITTGCAACGHALQQVRSGACCASARRRDLPVHMMPLMPGPGQVSGDSPYLGWWSSARVAWPILVFGVSACAFVLLVLVGAV